MDIFPLLVILIVVLVLIFLTLIGTYKDFASRSGVIVNSKKDLLLPPTAYAVAVISIFLPFVLFLNYLLFQLDFATIAALIVPLCLLLFCLMAFAGSLALWLAYARSQTWRRCLQLSARLMLVPIIDSFWSSVAVFITIEYASMASLCGVALIAYNVMSKPDLQSMLGALLSPMLGLQFVIFFPFIGLPIAYYIYKRGPSEALSKFYLVVGYGFLIICFVGAAYVYFSAGQVSQWIAGFLILAGVVISSINIAISRLYHYLRVTGVFGLELMLLSGFILFLTYEAQQILNTPIIGQVLYDLIPSFLWSIGYEVGIIGLISGILILLLARNQPEKGQVMTRAMAITIAISAFVPFLAMMIPIPYVGAFLGSFLVFVLVAPFYILAVNIIRVFEALKTMTSFGPSKKRCTSCGYKNKPQAKFCGKCGARL